MSFFFAAAKIFGLQKMRIRAGLFITQKLSMNSAENRVTLNRN